MVQKISQFREGSLNLKLGRPVCLLFQPTWFTGPSKVGLAHHPKRWISSHLGSGGLGGILG